jgi:hypothetical protein
MTIESSDVDVDIPALLYAPIGVYAKAQGVIELQEPVGLGATQLGRGPSGSELGALLRRLCTTPLVRTKTRSLAVPVFADTGTTLTTAPDGTKKREAVYEYPDVLPVGCYTGVFRKVNDQTVFLLNGGDFCEIRKGKTFLRTELTSQLVSAPFVPFEKGKKYLAPSPERIGTPQLGKLESMIMRMSQ